MKKTPTLAALLDALDAAIAVENAASDAYYALDTTEKAILSPALRKYRAATRKRWKAEDAYYAVLDPAVENL
jgi:hypothetical protein